MSEDEKGFYGSGVGGQGRKEGDDLHVGVDSGASRKERVIGSALPDGWLRALRLSDWDRLDE
jgi:hypothetical protein